MDEEPSTSYTIRRAANGKPIPNITWHKPGNVTPLTEGNSTVEIQFHVVNRGEAGTYICRAENLAGIVEAVV